MQARQANQTIDEFFARLRRASERILLLDYDGTLAPFQVDPAAATPYPGVVERLDAIMSQGRTRVVIVSGRWTRRLIPLLGLRRLPEIWGSHGWERLKTNGDYDTARIREPELQALVAADDWIADIEALGGRCERKPASIAVHWRGLDNAQIVEIRARLFERWIEIERREGLTWHDFDGGIELRAGGRDKGFVVDTVLAECAAGAAVAYLGDDTTDEDAFKALRGRGLGVLVRPQYRATAADVWLRPPQELLAFLERWHASLEGDE
jgi:trehalose-phosphatase